MNGMRMDMVLAKGKHTCVDGIGSVGRQRLRRGFDPGGFKGMGLGWRWLRHISKWRVLGLLWCTSRTLFWGVELGMGGGGALVIMVFFCWSFVRFFTTRYQVAQWAADVVLPCLVCLFVYSSFALAIPERGGTQGWFIGSYLILLVRFSVVRYSFFALPFFWPVGYLLMAV